MSPENSEIGSESQGRASFLGDLAFAGVCGAGAFVGIEVAGDTSLPANIFGALVGTAVALAFLRSRAE